MRVETRADAHFDGRLHWHDKEQVLIVVAGEVELRIEDVALVPRAGDFVFFPSGARHGALGVGPKGCVYYELFAPARFDQLPGWMGSSVLQFD